MFAALASLGVSSLDSGRLFGRPSFCTFRIKKQHSKEDSRNVITARAVILVDLLNPVQFETRSANLPTLSRERRSESESTDLELDAV